MSRFNFFGNISGENVVINGNDVIINGKQVNNPGGKEGKEIDEIKKPQPKSRNYMLQVTYG